MATEITTGVTILNSLKGYNSVSFTEFNSRDALTIAAGSVVEISGAFFQWASDETPSGWSAISTSETAYIALTPAGIAGSQTVSAAYTATAPTWRDDNQGWYASAGSSVRCIGSVLKGGATLYDQKTIFPETQTDSPVELVGNNAVSKVGTDLSGCVATAGTVAITAIGNNAIALIDDVNDELRTYTWDSAALSWSTTGSALGVAVTAPAICTIEENVVALVDSGTDTLRAYTWGGSSWSATGNATTITSIATPSIAGLSATRVAVVDNNADTLQAYSFDGTDWATEGTALTNLTYYAGGLYGETIDACFVTALNESTVAVLGQNIGIGGGDTLFRITFDGSSWDTAEALSSYTKQNVAASSTGRPAFCTIDSKHVFCVDTDLWIAYIATFNDPAWTDDPAYTFTSSATYSGVAAIDRATFVVVDYLSGLRVYRPRMLFE